MATANSLSHLGTFPDHHHLVSSDVADAVLLRDVQVLTLHRGRYTTARRSSPVPQLQCVGGSAGCGAFVLEVVQCYNRGWDGTDIQVDCPAAEHIKIVPQYAFTSQNATLN